MESENLQVKVSGFDDGRLKVEFPYDPLIVTAVKRIPGRKWCPKEKIWLLPDTFENGNRLLGELYNTGIFLYPDKIDCSKDYLLTEAVERMDRELLLKGFSPATIKAYNRHITWFFERTDLDPRNVRPEDIRFYLEKIKTVAGCSRSYAVQCISALKNLYLFGYPGSGMNPAGRIPHPKKEETYPDILSRNEVKGILESVDNPKHIFLLTLVYSAGLRVSEVVNLRKEDLDFERRMIHIRQSKGKKDRYVVLSEKAIESFRKYEDDYIIKKWLFAGARKGNHLSVRSAQCIFDRAVERAGIRKNVSIHSLRHAFATHLLEDGVDLRYIQELLGHKSVRTTEVYTHVTRTDIRNIKSPLDRWE